MADMLSVIYNDVMKTISGWQPDDIYAISFYVCDKDDNPGTPTLTVGYNTTEQALSDCSRGASSPGEAKWNYAFWLQNEEYLFGHDDKTARLIQDWISSLKLSNEESAITEAFINILIDVSLKLHNDGVIADVFGKEIPVIIHELEYYEAIALQNKKANPSGAVSEFLQWMDEEMLNPGLDCPEKTNCVGFDPNSPESDIIKDMDDELKRFVSHFKKKVEDGTIPEARWEEFKKNFPDIDEQG